MRGWPETFPQPHIKAGRQLLSHKRLPAHSGPGGGRGSRGPTLSTWPPRAEPASRGAAPAHCPLRAREAATAGRLGAVFQVTWPAIRPAPIGLGLAQCLGPSLILVSWEKGLWGTLPTPAAMPTRPPAPSPPHTLARPPPPYPACTVLALGTSVLPSPSPPCTPVTVGEHGQGLLPDLSSLVCDAGQHCLFPGLVVAETPKVSCRKMAGAGGAARGGRTLLPAINCPEHLPDHDLIIDDPPGERRRSGAFLEEVAVEAWPFRKQGGGWDFQGQWPWPGQRGPTPLCSPGGKHPFRHAASACGFHTLG